MIENAISTNENLVQVFCGVRGYEQDGVAYLHIEDSARGLGFVQTTVQNGKEYTKVRWSRVDGFLNELGFAPLVEQNGNPHDYYIPENIFYRLCMKAKNEVAEKFQAKVADEIIPSIRKTGSYSVDQQQPQSVMLPNFCNPAEAARAWADLYEKNQATELRALTAESERDETKALLAEEKEKNEYLERTKSWIGDKKVASAMGTAGALSKKCDRLEKELDKVKSEMDAQMPTIREAIRKEYEDVWMTAREWCFKHGLPVYSNEPKWVVSNRLVGICAMYPDKEQWHTNASGTRLFPKWACDVLDKVYDEDSTFLAEYRTT